MTQANLAVRRGASPVLWALVIFSLLLNFVIIGVLVLALVVSRQVAGDVADQLSAFSQQTINYKFRINQTVPIRTSVPFKKSIVVPFNQSMPISITVKVGKEIPVIGMINFDVPIQTEVPISLSIPITVDQSVDVNTDVPLNLEIPLEIPLRDTPIKGTLDKVVQVLNTFAGR